MSKKTGSKKPAPKLPKKIIDKSQPDRKKQSLYVYA
ncbi:hypothetical protein PMW_120 [Pseudomonas phage phiPMW]|uniref:Uncharacterized protein n=1 Tax=Pseudomonas phage phiPMW TaxID=1815582 RepID=A0A1S5R1F5_9CAUD|nr:hypothetical protein FDG97_gp120 [Pseudomonas phage phiPMW]ANA49245.1 hypothetical protein PMW_120 [Pseudomonas phage phiPMW]